MHVHGRPWVVQNRGWGRKGVPPGGWGTPHVLLFWVPQRTGGSLFSVLLTPGTCKCQASLGLGRWRTTSLAISSRCSLGSCFSNSTVCRDDLSPLNAYSRPHHGVRFSGSGMGPTNYFPSKFWGIAVAASSQTTTSVALLSPDLVGPTSIVTSSLYTHSVSLNPSLSLSLSRIYLNFSSVMFFSWLCFIPLWFLFTIILVTLQEEEKTKVYDQSVLFFCESSMKGF